MKPDDGFETSVHNGMKWYRAFDVDPLLAAKDAEIDNLTTALDSNNQILATRQAQLRQKEAELERLKLGEFNGYQAVEYQAKHISELEAENVAWEEQLCLQSGRIVQLEEELRQQKDECERFHKPA